MILINNLIYMYIIVDINYVGVIIIIITNYNYC